MGVIARQSIKGALANYVGVGIGFVTTFVVLTRCLTAEEVGMTRVMVDAAMLFSSLAQLGTNASIIRFFPHFKDDNNNHGIFGWSLLLPLIGFLIFGLLFLVFREQLTGLYTRQSPMLADYLYMLPMLTFFALYMTVFETNASVLMRIAVPKAVREIGVRVLTLVAYLLYGWSVVSQEVFVWLFCGSYGVAMVLNLCYLLSLGKVSFRIDFKFLDRGLLKEMLQYSLFMTITVLAGNIPLINSLFLGAKEGLALTGVYTIAFYIANVVEVPYRSLGAISRPVLAAAVKEGDWKEVNRLAREVSLHQFLVSSVIFLMIWINLDTLFALLPNGREYAAGVWVVFILGVAKIVNSSLSIATDVLNYSKYYARGLLFIVLLTMCAIGFNVWFIERWGIEGSAMATLMAYVVYFALLLVYLWWRQKVMVFSVGQMKVVAMMVVVLAVDVLWGRYVSALFGDRMLIEAVIKSIFEGGLMVVVIYFWQVSTTVNGMIDRYLHRRK